jgi:hypothetical protein
MSGVERPEHDPVLGVLRYGELLQDVVEDALGTIGREVSEDDDDHLVGDVLAVSRLRAQEKPLVIAEDLGYPGCIAVADVLRSEPQHPTFQGPGHEGTDRTGAAEILVRLDHVGVDPVCDGVERIHVAPRELARPPGVLEILEEERSVVCADMSVLLGSC